MRRCISKACSGSTETIEQMYTCKCSEYQRTVRVITDMSETLLSDRSLTDVCLNV